MNREIVVGFLKEHDRECGYEAISQRIKEKRNCTFCLDVNRDISILITNIKGARETIDVGLALSPDSVLSHYTPYEKAGFKLYFPRGAGESEQIAQVLTEAFSEGYERVVILSHSAPNIPVAYLERAVSSLRRGVELVVGPLENGMFYLVGLTKGMYDRLLRLKILHLLEFVNGRALEHAFKMFRDNSLKPRFLPKWYLVKTLEDLRKVSEDASRGRGWKARWVDRTISDLEEHMR